MGDPSKKQLELLQSMFNNADLGESVMVDIYKGSKGQIGESIDFLLEINKLKPSKPETEKQIDPKKMTEKQKINNGDKNTATQSPDHQQPTPSQPPPPKNDKEVGSNSSFQPSVLVPTGFQTQ